VNHPLPSVTYATIKQVLLNRLQAALGLYIPDASVLSQRKRHISLHRAKDNRRVLYVCAIALQLSGAKNIPALEIANAIATLIRQVESSPGSAVSCDFTVQVVPPGWIHLELTEPAIAAWLQHLAQGEQGELRELRELGENRRIPRPSSSRLFAIQYAHARCCSLLQMAHREGLITLEEPEKRAGREERTRGQGDKGTRGQGELSPSAPSASPAPPAPSALFHVVAPEPIPWLNSDQKLRFCQPAEHALIAQLLGLLDDLYCPCPFRQPIDWEKAAVRLSHAFQTFYSCCRIWGEVKIQTIHLAQARLGLVMATQLILRLLLQRLGISAPLEL
jgi:arginyl-tRNA synthetase